MVEIMVKGEPEAEIVEEVGKTVDLQQITFIHLNRIMKISANLYIDGLDNNKKKAFAFAVQMLESLNITKLKNNEYVQARKKIYEKYKNKPVLRTRKHFELIMENIDVETEVILQA